jgi:RNA polymerase sigma factor for flagellar operon FliA
MRLSKEVAISASFAEQFGHLWDAYMADRSDKNRNAIVTAYTPLVERVAAKLMAKLPERVELDDLMQWGALALMDAITRFEPARGVKFSTFAQRRIFGGIIDGLRDFDEQARLVRDRVKRLQQAEEELLQELSRMPSDEETAERLELSAGMYVQQQRQRCLANGVSMDLVVSVDQNGKELRIGDDIAAPPDTATETRMTMADLLHCAINAFGVMDALLVKLYYIDHWKLWEVGEAFGLSESRISQRHNCVVRRMRAMFAA